MKLFRIMLVVALVFAVSAVAYAETQSVKVSGDIALRGFARNNYTVESGGSPERQGNFESTKWQSFLQSTAEVQVDADLTDNVSGVIRLVNQRVWGDGNYYSNVQHNGITHAPYADMITGRANGTPGQANAFDVLVDLAYIELKEFLYSPLTIRIGRQDLWFGKGFIVGANLYDPENALMAPEYTAIRSFDAIRATLDYDPWTIDGVYAKIRENAQSSDDDINLYGVNVGYVFDDYNAEAEGYYWYKQARYPGSGSTTNNALTMIDSAGSSVTNDIHTIGLRGSFDPIEDWTIAVEGALQYGEYKGINNQGNKRLRAAWALDAMVEYRGLQEEYAWRPVFAAEYIVYSGEENIGNTTQVSNGLYTGWDPMYRGKFDTAIREFQNVFYRTAQVSTPSTTNQHQVLLRGSIEPTDDITVEGQWGVFWLYSKFATTDGSVNPEESNRYVGQELDVKVTWDYTEDVTFGLLSAWFVPGDHFSEGQGWKGVATDVVGTVKLSF